MTDLHLQCTNCKLKIKVTPDDQVSLFFTENYGQIDKVTGRAIEFGCPLCIGILEKINETDDVHKHRNVPKHDSFIHTQPKQPGQKLK